MAADVPELKRSAWLTSNVQLAAALRALADQLDPLPVTRPEIAELVMELLSLRSWLDDVERFALAEHRRLGGGQ